MITTIVNDCEKRNKPFPEPLASSQLLPESEFYWNAYVDLSTCRNSSMSVGQISWSDIMLWADRNKLDDEQREILKYIVYKMDEFYIKYSEEKQKRESKAKGK